MGVVFSFLAFWVVLGTLSTVQGYTPEIKRKLFLSGVYRIPLEVSLVIVGVKEGHPPYHLFTKTSIYEISISIVIPTPFPTPTNFPLSLLP